VIYGSAGAEKSGLSHSVFGVLTAKETVLSGQEGSWVLIVHDCIFLLLRVACTVGSSNIICVCLCVPLEAVASYRMGTGKSVGYTLGTRYIITAVL
jgi:hypothetical protein